MLHDYDDLLHARHQVHGPTHALNHLARDHPVGDVAILRDFHRAQYGQVDMPAADHRKAGGTVEIGRLRQLANGLFACIDKVGIFFAGKGEGPNAQHAVFGL